MKKRNKIFSRRNKQKQLLLKSLHQKKIFYWIKMMTKTTFSRKSPYQKFQSKKKLKKNRNLLSKNLFSQNQLQFQF